LLERLAAIDGPVVIYVTRQETAEEIATFLGKNGVAARAYHAGLPSEFRSDAQQAFMANDTRVIVATIAFGMGIDKPDIRGVIHYNLPKSLENHTQEIGRAGRDGQPAVCEMLACADDLTVLENFIYSDTPSPRALSNLIDRILRLGPVFDVSPYDLSVTCDIRPAVVGTVMTYLEMDGFIEATGSFYSTYRLKLLRPVERILDGRPAAEKSFVKRLLDAGEMKRYWLHFVPGELAAVLACSREKIVATLNGLEAADDARLSLSGVRHAYRMKKATEDITELARKMSGVFQQREQADLQRLRQVLSISSCRGCLTAYLLKHFGEVMTGPCGHCDRCRGMSSSTIKRRKSRAPTPSELESVRDLVAERHAALASPRQLARFLCGMTSPASQRARLTRHDAFGMLSDIPFAEAWIIAEAAIG